MAPKLRLEVYQQIQYASQICLGDLLIKINIHPQSTLSFGSVKQ